MPRIQGTRSVAGPPPSVSSDRREYLSPNRQWKVIYHNPREFHMGADGWRVQLRHNGFPMWGHGRELSRLAGPKGFRCEEDLQPWSHDSKALVFLTWDEEPVQIYEVDTKSLRQAFRGSDWVYSVQWSPGIDRLLVTSETSAVLTDQRSIRRGSAEWRIAPDDRPHTHWTEDGNWFFVLARESPSAKVMLTFYAGDDGRVGEAYELDPMDLVPYEAEQFAELPRDRFCLVVPYLVTDGGMIERWLRSKLDQGRTTHVGAVGLLLDTWHGVRFDQSSATLYLAVYRPVSSAYRGNVHRGEAEWVCNVEEQWVAVELAA